MTCDDLVSALDARPFTWSLYRAALGHWCITIHHKDGVQHACTGGTLSAVLEAAVAYIPLPVVPRCPVAPGVVTTTKSGSQWRVEISGAFCGYCASRAKALQAGERIAERQEAARQEWIGKWGAVVASGKEGADWRWEE